MFKRIIRAIEPKDFLKSHTYQPDAVMVGEIQIYGNSTDSQVVVITPLGGMVVEPSDRLRAFMIGAKLGHSIA